MSRPLPILALIALVAAACDSGNPVAPPPPDNGPGPGGGGVTVTVSASPSRLEAGASVPAVLTITARQNNAPVADGTEATVSTSLGQFSLDTSGQPVRTATVRLTGGSGTLELQAGSETGTANVLAQVGTSIGRLNLSIVEPAPRPVAEFTFEVNGLSVLFTDASTGDPTSFEWTFGDGTRSTEQSPIHTYAAPGTYTATLRVSSSSGSSSNKSKFVPVGVGTPLVAAFAFETSGLNVLFTDTSTGDPVEWSWDFGDGRTSTERNPAHSFAQAGTYAVVLTVTNAFDTTASTSRFVTVASNAPQAEFQFQANGLRVLFTDASTGNPTRWTWDFGDGTGSSARNPAHTYAQGGTYNVTLTAGSAAGSTSKSKFVTVSLGDPPQAEFQFQTNGLRVLFTDASTNNPTRWTWSFGDGTGSTDRDPAHTYAQAGTYNVTLTAGNAAGSTSKSKFVTVSLGDPPQANFEFQANGLNVAFQDRSTNQPTSWTWDFGDGATSTAQNPSHTYAQPGTYTVRLTAANAAGSGTIGKLVTVSTSAAPVANFCYQRNALVVIFTDTSTQSPTSWQWNFGDCESQGATCMSTAQNPGHTYLQAGTYAVSLTVTNAAGSSTRSKFVTVVDTPGPPDPAPICN